MRNHRKLRTMKGDSAFITAALLFSVTLHAGEPAAQVPASLHVDPAAVAEAGAVKPAGKITSAGQPDAAALAAFSDSGYVAVIDLRGEGEDRGLDEQAVVEGLGMRYLSLPVSGQDDISYDKAAELEQLIGAQDGPVLVHCGSGNRVGALLALIESGNGAADEAAIAKGREGGLTGLEGVVRERLAEKKPAD